MRVTPAEVLELAVRAEHARQPNLARELYTIAGRMDREPGTDGLEPGDGRDDRDMMLAAWSRGFRLAGRLGMDGGPIDVPTAAGRVS